MANDRTQTESVGKLSLILRYVALALCVLVVFDVLTIGGQHFAATTGAIGGLVALLCLIGFVLQVVSWEKSHAISNTFGLPTPSREFIHQKQEEQTNKPELQRLVG